MNRFSPVLCWLFVAAAPLVRGQDWAAILDVDGAVAAWSVTADPPAAVVADSGDFHKGGSSAQLRLSAGALKASLTAKASVPGTLTFWWKLEGEPDRTRATFTAEGVELARLSELGAWKKTSVFVRPDGYALAWNVAGSQECEISRLRVDEVTFTPADTVAAGEALDLTGGTITLAGAGWLGLRSGATEVDGDALYSPKSGDAHVLATVTGPAYLYYSVRADGPQASGPRSDINPGEAYAEEVVDGSGATLTPRVWQKRRILLFPGLNVVRWTAFAGQALDALSVSAPLQIPLAEAADYPGDWSGTATGVALSSDTGDASDRVIMNGPAVLSLDGPGMLRWKYRAGCRVKVNDDPVRTYTANFGLGELVLGAGRHTVTWSDYPSTVGWGSLDEVRFEPSLPLAEALDTTAIDFTATGPVAAGQGTGAPDGGGEVVRIAPGGALSAIVTGPGLLRFWGGLGLQVEVGGRLFSESPVGWHEVDLTGAPTAIRWLAPANAAPVMVDRVSLVPDPAQRWGERLGSAPESYWYVHSTTDLQTLDDPTTPGRRVLRPAAPWTHSGSASTSLFSLAPASDGNAFLHLRHTQTGGASLRVRARGSTPQEFVQPAGAQDWSSQRHRLPAGTAAAITFTWSGAPLAYPWQLSDLRFRAATPATTIAEALDSTLNWAPSGAGWSPLNGIPAPDGDALYAASVGPTVTAALDGPVFFSVWRQGQLEVQIDGAESTPLTADPANAGVVCHFLEPGPHVLGLRARASTALPVILDDFRLAVPEFALLPELDSTDIQFAAPPDSLVPGCPLPVPVGAGEAWDRQDALRLDRCGLIARVNAPGYLTWRTRGSGNLTVTSPSATFTRAANPQWTLDSMVVAAADHVKFRSSGAQTFDDFRLTPVLPVGLEEAADYPGLTLTSDPENAWHGRAGAAISHDGVDALTHGGDGGTLAVEVPQDGTLTWWWRRTGTATVTVTGSSTVPPPALDSGAWRFGLLPVTGGDIVTFNASGAAGSVWIDAMHWTPDTRLSMEEGADFDGLAWSTSTTDHWRGVPAGFAEGDDVVWSGSDGQNGYVQALIPGPALVSFSAWLNSYDGFLAVELPEAPGVPELMRTGAESSGRWGRHSLLLGPGSHAVRWSQRSMAAGDSAFLDAVTVEPLTAPPPESLAHALDLPSPTASADGLVRVLPGEASQDGADAVQIGGAAESASRVTVTVPRNRRLVFHWACPQPDAGTVAGAFSLDGLDLAGLRGDTGWTRFEVDLPPGAGNATLEWRSIGQQTIRLDRVELSALEPPSLSPAAAATDDPAITWLENPQAGGAGWHATRAHQVDGWAAASDGAAVTEWTVNGPGWVVFEAAAGALQVTLDGTIVPHDTAPGFPFIASGRPEFTKGFMTHVIPLAPGLRRVRLASDGRIVLDRLRLSATHPAPPLQWRAGPTLRTTLRGQDILYASDGTAPGSEVSTILAGPGTLSFSWATDGTHTMYLDGRYLQSFRNGFGAWRVWDMLIDIPPGVHRFSMPLGQGGLILPSGAFTPGAMELSSGSGAQGLNIHSIGIPWRGIGGELVPGTYVDSTTDLGMGLTGPALFRTGTAASPLTNTSVLEFRDRPVQPARSTPTSMEILFDRQLPWTVVMEPSWGRLTAPSAQPLEPVPLAEAMESLPGWLVSGEARWAGYRTPAPFDSQFTGGTAVLTTILPEESPAPLLVTPPAAGGHVSLRAGAVRGQPRFDGLTIKLGTFIVRQPPAASDRLQSFALELPPGSGSLSFEAQPDSSNVLDGMTPLPPNLPRIGSVLSSSSRPWIAELNPSASYEGLFHPSATSPESIRLAGDSQLTTVIQGPCVVKVDAVTAPPAALLIDCAGVRYFLSEPSGSFTVPVAASGNQRLTLASFFGTSYVRSFHVDQAVNRTTAPTLPDALDARHLSWQFSPGWHIAAHSGVALDTTGYVMATARDFNPETIDLTLSGRGILAFRTRGNGAAFEVRRGESTLLRLADRRSDWQRYTLAFDEPGPFTLSFILFGVGGRPDFVNEAFLDAVTWTPAITVPPNSTTDSDGDSVPDLLEYAFGLDPGTVDAHSLAPGMSSGLPTVAAGVNGTFALEFLRRRDVDLLTVPEFSASLHGPWQPSPELIETLECLNPLWDRCRAVAPPGAAFGRVRVSRLP